jgi:hypothetical protein
MKCEYQEDTAQMGLELCMQRLNTEVLTTTPCVPEWPKFLQSYMLILGYNGTYLLLYEVLFCFHLNGQKISLEIS